MDVNAGPVGIYVVTKLVYVVTLQLTLCVFKLCYGFVERFLT